MKKKSLFEKNVASDDHCSKNSIQQKPNGEDRAKAPFVQLRRQHHAKIGLVFAVFDRHPVEEVLFLIRFVFQLDRVRKVM
ncbi:hypothetical protein IY145_24920 [Methylosinus sp. H3A]|uniref:hypothetical protein n=1 Tax=Methylosinus sp. H3A TaxID=2785786 RepID=UPI0018C2E5F7|nr:hypothetical protein [Methylosinus sp. H3A]MBG0812569.1 hypothetical protein [Methylosinus sp. H3A]